MILLDGLCPTSQKALDDVLHRRPVPAAYNVREEAKKVLCELGNISLTQRS